MLSKRCLLATIAGVALSGLIVLVNLPTVQAAPTVPVRAAVYSTSNVGAVHATPVHWGVWHGYHGGYYRPYGYAVRPYAYYRPYYRPYAYRPYVYRPYVAPFYANVYPRYYAAYPSSFAFNYAYPSYSPYYGAYPAYGGCYYW